MRALLPILLALLAAVPAAADTLPRREDHGDLIVLYVRGIHREMGQQQAELLGDALAPQCSSTSARSIAAGSQQAGALGARLLERLGLPLASGLAGGDAERLRRADRGLARRALGVPPREVLRASFALDAGSTVFAPPAAPPRTAPADRAQRRLGRRRGPPPPARHPLPADERRPRARRRGLAADLALHRVGLNEAGFALSLQLLRDRALSRPLRRRPGRTAARSSRRAAWRTGIRIFTRVEAARLRLLHGDGRRLRRDRAGRVPAGERLRRVSGPRATGSRRRTTRARRR